MNHAFRSALAIVTLGLALAACSAGGAASAPSEPPPSEAPTSGDPGIGVPEPGGVELVEPQPGQQNVHPVPL